MRLDYFLYMNEAEGTGLVDTHDSKVNQVINALRKYYRQGGDPNEIWRDVCRKYNLSPDSLTNYDKNKINKEVYR